MAGAVCSSVSFPCALSMSHRGATEATVSSSFSDGEESVATKAPYALIGGSPGRLRQLCCSRFFKWLPKL